MKRIATLGILTGTLAMFFMVSQYTAYASKANSVSISVDMHLTGPTSAEGAFKASGAISDAGTATETFQIAADGKSVEGDKTLVGSKGEVSLHFSGSIVPLQGGASLQVTGTWQAVSGTQAYSGISGGGPVNTILNMAAGTLHADYTGDVSVGNTPGMPRTGAPYTGAMLLLAMAAAAILAGALLARQPRLIRRERGR